MNVTTTQLILMGVGSLGVFAACAYVLYKIVAFLVLIYRGAMEAARAGRSTMSPRWTRITLLGGWTVLAVLVVIPVIYAYIEVLRTLGYVSR